MKPYYKSKNVTIYHSRCIPAMMSLPRNSVDSIVTDPPYALKQNKKSKVGFMGKAWDGAVPGVPHWKAALRAAKPGAMLFAFGGTRTHHRLMCAIEDAGWIIRDVMMWVYGQGRPAGMDIGKAIDRASGATRKTVGRRLRPDGTDRDPQKTSGPGNVLSGSVDGSLNSNEYKRVLTAPATPEAKPWDGYNTTLKPAWEPIILAMKPLDGTFAQNAQKWGVAGLWIDGCRVGVTKNVPASVSRTAGNSLCGSVDGSLRRETGQESGHNPNIGRYPSNLVHDGSPDVLALLPNSKGQLAPARTDGSQKHNSVYGAGFTHTTPHIPRVESDKSAARFFYCSKAPKRERWIYCSICNDSFPSKERKAHRHNLDNWKHTFSHPTQKPLSLMRYLCRLSRTPTESVVLDPFMGSGSTLIAAVDERRRVIGIDMDLNSCRVATKRIEAHLQQGEKT